MPLLDGGICDLSAIPITFDLTDKIVCLVMIALYLPVLFLAAIYLLKLRSNSLIRLTNIQCWIGINSFLFCLFRIAYLVISYDKDGFQTDCISFLFSGLAVALYFLTSTMIPMLHLKAIFQVNQKSSRLVHILYIVIFAAAAITLIALFTVCRRDQESDASERTQLLRGSPIIYAGLCLLVSILYLAFYFSLKKKLSIIMRRIEGFKEASLIHKRQGRLLYLAQILSFSFFVKAIWAAFWERCIQPPFVTLVVFVVSEVIPAVLVFAVLLSVLPKGVSHPCVSCWPLRVPTLTIPADTELEMR